MKKTALAIVRSVDRKIEVLRGQKVILDVHLAELYGVTVRHLNQQVKRNLRRFPEDFLMHVSRAEYKNLRSQIVISSSKHGGRRYLPLAFTEHGAIMAATVLNSKRAIEMSIFVVRAFARMREALVMNQKIASKLEELEQRLENHDVEIQELFETLRELMIPSRRNRRRIGFQLPVEATRALVKEPTMRALPLVTRK
jgi:hypothetical protein